MQISQLLKDFVKTVRELLLPLFKERVNNMMVKEIPGFPNYTVSNTGEVFSEGRKMKPFRSLDGYYKVDLRDNGRRKTEYVHRLVAKAFIPMPDWEADWVVDHIDGDKLNNNVNNLQWLTRAENSRKGGRKKKKVVITIEWEE